ncbi:MAG: SufD family Fe-S cluster assembly protein [Alistipes sp.]|nr:SufD family Fe-S cluster assembly protein [Alistipes sp.]
MNPIRKYLDDRSDVRPIDGLFPSDASAEALYYAVDPASLPVTLPAGAAARLVVLHESATASALRIELGEGARLELVEVFLAEAFAEIEVTQAARSECRITTLQLAGANLSCRMSLDGRDAACGLHGLFLAGEREHCVVKLRTEHNVADCRSESFVKGVAGGEALGEFCGLVYVAPDAQRTDAQQQSRNVLLSDEARIDTRPQLEIYADDVKCTHGATVGQMDDEAIFYMRQRGLSEAQARRLQIEGFAADVVGRCGIEPLRDALMQLVAAKMERM